MANEVPKSDGRVFTVYGTGTAATDNDRFAAIVTRVNALAAKCTIRFDGRGSSNEVHITTLHTITAPADLECVGDTFVVRNYNSGIQINNPIIPWDLAITGTMAARSKGAASIGGASIDAQLNPLDYVAIWADNNLTTTTPHAAGVPSRPMEIHRLERREITAGGATTTSWVIQDELDDDFTTSPQIAKITTMLKGIKLTNFRMKVAPGAYNGENIGNCITFNGCDDVVLENCVFGPNSPGAVGFDMCMNVRRVNCRFGHVENANTQLQFSTYGIVDNTCNRTETTGCKFGTLSHGMTTGGRNRVISSTTYRYGGPKLQTLDGCDFRGVGYQVTATGNWSALPQLDWHTEGRRAKVRNCTFTLQAVSAGTGCCINARCRDLEVTGSTFHCGNNTTPWQIRGANQTWEGNRVFGGLTIIQDSYGGLQPNIDNLKIRQNLFANMQGGSLRIHTGTNIDIDENTFFNVGNVGVSSPFNPKTCIYIASLTDSSSVVRVRKNTMPKMSNDYALYASSLGPAQLEYEGNIVPGYGGASIGIARKRIASDPSGAVDTLIDAVFEWEAEYAHTNGQQKWIYVKEAGHGLVTADLDSPIISTHDVYDDTVAGTPIVGWLIDVASTDWYILAPPGATIEIPPGTINGTYSTGDGRNLKWDASTAGGKLVVSTPVDSAADAPSFRVNYYSSTMLQITLPIAGTGGGTFEWAAIEW